MCDGIPQCEDKSDEEPNLHCPGSNTYSQPESQIQDLSSLNPMAVPADRQKDTGSSSSIALRSDDSNLRKLIPKESGHISGDKAPPSYDYPKGPDSRNVIESVKDFRKQSISNNDFASRAAYENNNYNPNFFPRSGSSAQSFSTQYYPQGKDYFVPQRGRVYTGDDYPNNLQKDFGYWPRNEDARGLVDRSDDLIGYQQRRVGEPNYVAADSVQRQLVPQALVGNGLSWLQPNGLNGYSSRLVNFQNGNLDPMAISRIEPAALDGEAQDRLELGRYDASERPMAARRAKNLQLAEESQVKAKPLNKSSPAKQVPSVSKLSNLNADRLTHTFIAPIAISRLNSRQPGRDTNSAVIALVLGLMITGMLVALVMYRMKYIRRKIARRGRNLAHDADYLVNGMYL